MAKYLRPEDASRYCNIPAQGIREGLKRGKFDFGYAVNKTGKRYAYYINPIKFFNWLGLEVPSEWRVKNESSY